MERKILIACRDDTCRNTLLQSLPNGNNLTVRSIWDEATLLLEVLEEDFTAIIYDLEFSKIDGLKMVKLLRRIRPRFPLFVLTNDTSLELGGKILQEGVTFYELKPIYSETIKQVILSALKQSH